MTMRWLITFLVLSTGATTAHPATSTQHVPFVGCRSDGQLGPQDAPKSMPTPKLPEEVASKLALYRAADGPAVLAPQGWHCFGVYGSNGSVLIITPEVRHSKEFFGDHPFSTKGPAVEAIYSNGGTSGRFAVGNAIARYFPAHRDFIRQNPDLWEFAPLPKGPFPADLLKRRSSELVQFTTPSAAKGMGTASYLAPSVRPIEGFVKLLPVPDGPDLWVVDARLPAEQSGLTSTILEFAAEGVR